MTNNMATWGEGAKRLEFELRPVHNLCEYHLNGLTYMIRAYHMENLGHFYETIFRLFLELKSRSDFMKVKQIIILNAGKEVELIRRMKKLSYFMNFYVRDLNLPGQKISQEKLDHLWCSCQETHYQIRKGPEDISTMRLHWQTYLQNKRNGRYA
ncbi:unnamed protein product [Bathycoccus prasinos]